MYTMKVRNRKLKKYMKLYRPKIRSLVVQDMLGIDSTRKNQDTEKGRRDRRNN